MLEKLIFAEGIVILRISGKKRLSRVGVLRKAAVFVMLSFRSNYPKQINIAFAPKNVLSRVEVARTILIGEAVRPKEEKLTSQLRYIGIGEYKYLKGIIINASIAFNAEASCTLITLKNGRNIQNLDIA